MSEGLKIFPSEDGTRVLFDPESGKYFRLLENAPHTPNFGYNNQVVNFGYQYGTGNMLNSNYDYTNYEPRHANTYTNEAPSFQQPNTAAQYMNINHQKQQKYQQLHTNTWKQDNAHPNTARSNTQQNITKDKHRQANSTSIQTSTPKQQEQTHSNMQEENIDESRSNPPHQQDTTTANKRALNDSDDFITKGTNKAQKLAQREGERLEKASTATTNPVVQEDQRKHNMPLEQVQRAITHNLPCFVIKFDQLDNLPAAVAVAEDLYEYFTNKQINLSEGFSVVRYSGNHLRVGVKNKEDYQLLSDAKKWPTKILGRSISINIPKFIPEQFSLVVRFIPKEFTADQVARELKRSASTANNFRAIVYPYPRATNDFRLSVADLKEYNGLLRLGHIGIANMMRKITLYRPSNNLTYCTKCWQLEHTCNQCHEQVQKCRICLLDYNQHHNDVCSKQYRCAQCHQDHYSLDGDCPAIQQYRQQLNRAVKQAIADGTVKRITGNRVHDISPFQPMSNINNFPPMTSSTATMNRNTRSAPWATSQTPANNNKAAEMSNTQLFEKLCAHFDEKTLQINSRLSKMEEKIRTNEATIVDLHQRLINVMDVVQPITQTMVQLNSSSIANNEENTREIFIRATSILNEEMKLIKNSLNDKQNHAQDGEEVVEDKRQVEETQQGHIINLTD
jgi:hypothetical protein